MPPVVSQSPSPLTGKRPREESPELSPVSKIALTAIAAAAAAVPDPNAELPNNGWDEEEVEPLTQAEVQAIIVKAKVNPRDFAISFRSKEMAKRFVKYIEKHNVIHDLAIYREDYDDELQCYRVHLILRPVAIQQRKSLGYILDLLEFPEQLSEEAAAAGQFSYLPSSLKSSEEAFQ